MNAHDPSVHVAPNNVGAKQPRCEIQGCGKLRRTRQWCSAHYSRWRRYGDPLGGSTAFGDPMRFYLDVVVPCDRGLDDPCLVWPYARRRGYGVLWRDNKNQYVSRLICEDVYGPPPTPEHEAAHSCGHGGKGCVTKSHLRWATHEQNCEDTVAHGRTLRGRRHPKARLTREQVLEIRELRRELTLREIACRFGVSIPTVSSILHRRSWAWL